MCGYRNSNSSSAAQLRISTIGRSDYSCCMMPTRASTGTMTTWQGRWLLKICTNTPSSTWIFYSWSSAIPATPKIVMSRCCGFSKLPSCSISWSKLNNTSTYLTKYCPNWAQITSASTSAPYSHLLCYIKFSSSLRQDSNYYTRTFTNN